jgi:hypothetical protein
MGVLGNLGGGFGEEPVRVRDLAAAAHVAAVSAELECGQSTKSFARRTKWAKGMNRRRRACDKDLGLRKRDPGHQ